MKSSYFIAEISSCPRPGIIYPIATHWAWADSGWLRNLGFVDFAGSGTVHAVAGASCVVAAVLAGPRIGRFTPDGRIRQIQPHSLPVTRHEPEFSKSNSNFPLDPQQVALGSFIFLFGIMAFNGGSRGSISKAGDAAVVSRVVVNTLICITGATISGCVYCRYFYQPTVGKWSFMGAINGSFVGMVIQSN